MTAEGSELLRAPWKKCAKSSFRIADIKRGVETSEGRTLTLTSVISLDSILWRFDPVPGYGLPFQGFAITPHSVGLLWASDQPVAETT
jgi:hypothetical protein